MVISYQMGLGVKIASRKGRKDAKEDGAYGGLIYS